MRILLIWDGEYPWDIRVSKVAQTLLHCGHEIHMVCRNRYGKPRYELYQGLHLHRIAALPRVLAWANGAFTFPAFFNPVWIIQLIRTLRRERCEMIIVRDLPMAPVVRVMRLFARVPALLDMAECYPEMLRAAWQFERFRWSNLLVRNPAIADYVERRMTRTLDHIFVMVEESRDRLLRKGVPAERISIVSNTPDLSRFPRPALPGAGEGSAPGSAAIQLLYVGLLNPSRGVDIMIRAAALRTGQPNAFTVRVVGSGKHANALRNLAAELKVTDRIHFDGWVDNSLVPGIVANAAIGVVPHYSCSHWNTTIPNKIFDYMAAGKPVIVSDAIPAARIVRETGCGLVYSSADPGSLAAVVDRMADPAVRQRMGMAGRDAVESKFNWGVDGAILSRVVENLRLKQPQGAA
jgi:glycosyltransferase involved in cell wall biosynthesis